VRNLLRGLAVGVIAAAMGAAPVTAGKPPEEGLVVYDRGPAAYYSSSYDNGGWASIIARRLAWGQHDRDTFPYSPEGYYCVHPDFVFGNVVTLENPRTGATVQCTIADMVAPADQAHWRSSVVIEVSYRCFRALELNEGNEVELWVLPASS
jgi:hypothetical protein